MGKPKDPSACRVCLGCKSHKVTPSNPVSLPGCYGERFGDMSHPGTEDAPSAPATVHPNARVSGWPGACPVRRAQEGGGPQGAGSPSPASRPRSAPDGRYIRGDSAQRQPQEFGPRKRLAEGELTAGAGPGEVGGDRGCEQGRDQPGEGEGLPRALQPRRDSLLAPGDAPRPSNFASLSWVPKSV